MRFMTIALFLVFFGFAQLLEAQEERTPQLPDWVIFLAQLGDFYQQWCEDQGAEYARDPNHQLGIGGQWKCYLDVPERPRQG